MKLRLRPQLPVHLKPQQRPLRWPQQLQQSPPLTFRHRRRLPANVLSGRKRKCVGRSPRIPALPLPSLLHRSSVLPAQRQRRSLAQSRSRLPPVRTRRRPLLQRRLRTAVMATTARLSSPPLNPGYCHARVQVQGRARQRHRRPPGLQNHPQLSSQLRSLPLLLGARGAATRNPAPLQPLKASRKRRWAGRRLVPPHPFRWRSSRTGGFLMLHRWRRRLLGRPLPSRRRRRAACLSFPLQPRLLPLPELLLRPAELGLRRAGSLRTPRTCACCTQPSPRPPRLRRPIYHSSPQQQQQHQPPPALPPFSHSLVDLSPLSPQAPPQRPPQLWGPHCPSSPTLQQLQLQPLIPLLRRSRPLASGTSDHRRSQPSHWQSAPPLLTEHREGGSRLLRPGGLPTAQEAARAGERVAAAPLPLPRRQEWEEEAEEAELGTPETPPTTTLRAGPRFSRGGLEGAGRGGRGRQLRAGRWAELRSSLGCCRGTQLPPRLRLRLRRSSRPWVRLEQRPPRHLPPTSPHRQQGVALPRARPLQSAAAASSALRCAASKPVAPEVHRMRGGVAGELRGAEAAALAIAHRS